MKKLFAAVMVFVMILSVLPVGIMSAYATDTYDPAFGLYIDGYFEYSVSNGKAAIGYYNGPDYADVIIPSSLGGYPVTSIGYYGGAMLDCWPFMSRSPVSVTLPSTITYLGMWALKCDDTNMPANVYFYGNAPSFYNGDSPFGYNTKIYYQAGRTGYSTPYWMGCPCEPFGNIVITFDAQGGSVSPATSTLSYPGTYGSLPAPTKTGYTFGGWFTSTNGGGTQILSYTTISAASTQTLYAKWTANTYTVVYNGNGSTDGSTESSSHTYDAAKTLTPSGFTKTGFTFLGWATSSGGNVVYTDNQSVSNLTATNGAAVTLYAKWRETDPVITFNSNGGSAVADITPGYNNSVSKPTDPEMAGLNFVGWYMDPELTTPVIWPFTVTQSAAFYAEWNGENYTTIIFAANGGVGSASASIPVGDPLTAPAVARTGYTFAGWSPIVPDVVPAERTVYTAQWTANTYSVNYSGNGNDAGSTASSLHTYDIASPLAANGFTKTGHSLAGWSTDSGATAPTYTDGQSVLNLTQNQGDVITLYAVWAINSYTITFSANGGSGGTSTSKLYGDALSAPTVTRTGYTFANWLPEVPTTVPAENTTYTAQWIANTYTVTFDAQGGMVSPETKTITFASTYGTLPTPTKTGYTFGGWYTGAGGTGTNRSSTSTVTTASDHTLYAKWTGIMYSVDYIGNGSTGGSMPTSFHYYGTAKALVANSYTKTGYAFTGWATSPDGDIVYSDKQSVSNLTEISEGINLYAKWTDVDVATITFDANGGTGGSSTTLLIGSTLTAPTVKRTGYTFASWSTSVPSTVPAENTIYIAQWTARTFTVTFNPQSGTVTPTSSTITYDSTYGAGTGGFPTPTRTGYTFGGWFTSTNGAGTQILSTTIAARTSSQTLYAKWTANQYTVTFDANGGAGGTSGSMSYGTALTAPAVTKTGYVFTGWSQTVPETVGAEDALFTAQWNMLGDIGSDNHINALDALIALRASSGTTALTDIQKLFADVSKDGKVNSLDALMILKYASGKITSFE